MTPTKLNKKSDSDTKHARLREIKRDEESETG